MIGLLLAFSLVAFDGEPDPWIELPGDASLLIPGDFRPRDGEVDITLHLHGAKTVLAPAFAEAKRPGVLVAFNRKGLSKVYQDPFGDPKLLGSLLDAAIAKVREARKESALRIGRVTISSFSAGFGGVRAILRDPENFARVDAIVLADSLYCGYDPRGDLDDALMRDFRRFAAEAAAGKKRLLVSHSAQVPEGYGSTTETAEDLATRNRAGDRPLPGGWPEGWSPSRYRSAGGLRILGFPGAGPEDHMQHLRKISRLWLLLESA